GDRRVGEKPRAMRRSVRGRPRAMLAEDVRGMKAMAIWRALKTVYVQVLIGIALGVIVGWLWPEFGASLKPLGDAFVKLIKMLIAPVIFCTVAAGIARMNDLKSFGRIGGRALIYFEAVSTLALLIGLVVGEVVRPGAGFNVD